MTITMLTPLQVRALLAAAVRTRESARDTALVALCVDAGPHRSELARVTRQDFDPARRLLWLGSGDTRRALRLSDTTVAAVLAVAGVAPGDHVLATRSGRPLTSRTIHEQLLTVGALAGLGQWVTARHLRRTFIASVAGRYPLPVAMRLAGHDSSRMAAAAIQQAIGAQFAAGQMSVLDALALQAARSRAA